jgi:hypothetical protein
MDVHMWKKITKRHTSDLCAFSVTPHKMQTHIRRQTLKTFVALRFWTQGFMLAGQALYHLSHSISPFCVGCFKIGSLNYSPRLALNYDPPDLCFPSS